jgi:hypothetical protein
MKGFPRKSGSAQGIGVIKISQLPTIFTNGYPMTETPRKIEDQPEGAGNLQTGERQEEDFTIKIPFGPDTFGEIGGMYVVPFQRAQNTSLFMSECINRGLFKEGGQELK